MPLVPFHAVASSTTTILLLLLAAATAYRRHRRRCHHRGALLVLVGAGPGDPDLMTFAAARELSTADVVIADSLIPSPLLSRFVPPSCRLLVANKTKGQAHAAQAEIYDWISTALASNQTVVRLKGGDPFLYGRGGEEVAEFRKLGYRVKVVPGVSSALAGPASIGVPVTTRGVANELSVCTVHGKNETVPSLIPAFNPQRTVVFLMSVSRVDYLASKLAEAQYPPDLGVAIVEHATMPTQRSFKCTTSTLIETTVRNNVQSPAVIVVGQVTSHLVENTIWDQGGVVFL